jgi:hypothetical protein
MPATPELEPGAGDADVGDVEDDGGEDVDCASTGEATSAASAVAANSCFNISSS